MMLANTIPAAERPGQQDAIVSLPDVPSDMYGTSGKEYQQARAWEVIWDWCVKHGLATHSYEHRDQYDKLNGPQMIAQWIIDMKSALYFCEQMIGGADSDARRTHSGSAGVAMCDGETPRPAMATEAEPSLSRCDSGPIL